MENNVLRDLGVMVQRVKETLELFNYDDIQLSTGFKKAFSNNVSSSGNSVEYKKTTAIITNTSGQKIYAPNQWFVLATYPVDLIKEIIKYRNITEKMLEAYQSEFLNNDGTQIDKKDIYKGLKSSDNAGLKARFESCILKYLKSLNQNGEEIQENTKLLMRFVTDDKWWLGGKGIERTNDFYVSPVLGSLNLVNASQSYVATITYAYVNDEKLYKELDTIIASSDYCDDFSGDNEYERAAETLKNHVIESGLVFEENEADVRSIYDEFQERFAPDLLLKISDRELPGKMFYSAESTNDSLCYWLEFEQRSKKLCGSIAGGSSYKFGLFQRKEDGVWITGSPNKPEEISDERALEIAKSIRDVLVKGSEIINSANLSSLSDYEKLDMDLNDAIGKYALLGWVHKYFHMLYPDKLSAFHSSEWQKHVLYALKIKPSEKYYARSGQIAMIGRYANWKYYFLSVAFFDKFGGIKKFYRLGTSDNDGKYAAEWKKQGIAAIGWSGLGSLEEYVAGNDINKKALAEKMQAKYYPDNPQLASRKAGEVAAFYRTNSDSVFVAMDGNTPLALIDDIGSYYYDGEKSMAHIKSGTWHCCFKTDEKLPNKSVGHMTSCYELSDDDDLMYLYEKYYYDLTDREEGEDEMQESMPDNIEYIKPEYNTGFETDFERNKIVFGAPGTGKSYKLKKQAEELIGCAETHMERVTFHSDYTYSQFVGSYKPVTDVAGNIRYDFVPGPFMRVYVNAVKNIQQIIRAYELIGQADTMYMFPTNPNPSNAEEKWDLFEEITEVGQEELFHSSKDTKVGDLALIYVAKTKSGYDNGIYAIGTIVKKEREDLVIIRFDYVSYYYPIIDYETLKEYNPNIRSNGRVNDDIVNLIKETTIPANPYLLLIEEINRAKVAAVFGDVFQLLDRGDDGVSEYDIQTSEDARKYLASQLGGEPQNWLKIKLPDNMFIWATMNSADQGVFPMDTAFKRRWEFEYLGINDGEDGMKNGMITLGAGAEHEITVNWNCLRKAINEKLAGNDFKVNEDKLMGPFFLSGKVTEPDSEGNIANPDLFIKEFKSKVIMYLYEDAAKQYKHKLFSGCDSSRYSAVCEAFDEIGIDIFGDGFRELYNQQEG